jgi:hypothetical protein
VSGAIVKFDAKSDPGSLLKVKVIAVVVGLPTALAVHVISPAAISNTDCGSLAIPVLFMETITVPALTLEIFNVQTSPLPDNVPRVAEPVPGAIVKSDAVREPGLEVNSKVIAVVVGLPVALAVQVISPAAESITV